MLLKHLLVKNFRALEDIEIDFESRVNVVVGPNGIGKTTVLEAIRLAKAILAPRTQNEALQVLFALGASSPFDPNRFIPNAIVRDAGKPTEIRCRYVLSADEAEALDAAVPQIAAEMVLLGAGTPFQNAALATGMLSSPAGRAAVSAAEG